MTDEGAPTDDDFMVQQVLAAWFEGAAQGDSKELEELCSEVPHLLPRVRKLLGRETKVEAALKDSPSGWGSDSGALSQETVNAALAASLSDFSILSTIGEGGTGTVFLAQQRSLNRLVALKIMKTRTGSDHSLRLRFQREAEITASLDHPHIVPIYAAGEDDGHLFIAMKLLEAPTLAEQPSCMEPKAAAAVFESLARALQAAHDIGVVHRDVKPANIIIVQDHPYLLDFGFARGREDVTVTREGAVAGTLAYMAPEYLQDARAFLDPRIDVYSLGATLYEALAGHAPFQDDAPQVLMRKILTQEPPALRLAEIHRPLAIIVERAMAKEPSKRFPSAADFADELARFHQGTEILSRPFSLAYRLRRKVYRNPWAATFLLVAMAALAVAGLVAWSEAHRTERRLEAGLHDVEQALAGGRLNRADELLDGLSGDGHPQAALAPWRRRVAADRALSVVLDQLQNPAQAQDAHALEVSASELSELGDAVSSPELKELALSICRTKSGGGGEPVMRLDQVKRFPRAKVAVQAYAQGQSVSEALSKLPWPCVTTEVQTTDSLRADDHVLASTVLRLQGAPRELRERELHAARQLDYRHYRARYALAVMYWESGDYNSALLSLDSAADPEHHRSIVLMGLARLYALTGQRALSLHFLARAKARIGDSEICYRPALALVESEVLIHGGDVKQARELLADAAGRWPDHRGIKLMLAQLTGVDAEGRESARLALEAIKNGVSDQLARRAELALLEMDFLAINGPQVGPLSDEQWDGDVKRELRQIAMRAQKLSVRTEAEGALATSSACDLLLSRCQRLGRAPQKAWSRLQLAITKNPWNLAARLRYALEVTHRTEAFRGDKADSLKDMAAMGTVDQLLLPAREHARFVINAPQAKRGTSSLHTRKLAWICDAVLSYSLNHVNATRKSAKVALRLLADCNETESDVADLLRHISQ